MSNPAEATTSTPAVTDAPAASRSQNRKRKRGKPSSDARMDAHRESMGASFEASRRRKIEERTGGFSSEIPLPGLAELSAVIDTLIAEVPVSTRGMGFSVATCYEKIHRQFPTKVGELATIHQVYRACLAQSWLVRARCQESRAKATLNPDSVDDVYVPYECLFIEDHKRTFAGVANVISSFGWFDHAGALTWPTVPPTPLYDDDTLIPRSCLVKAEELRALVLQLSDPDVPEEDRKAFSESNSLPGATWDDDWLLTNADIVCPPEWPSRRQLMSDFLAYEALLSFAETKMSYLLGTVDYSGRGSANALVSRRMQVGDSRLAYDNGIAVVYFSALEDFYATDLVEEQLFLRGALSLAGEWIEADPPPYRHEPSARRRVNLDWSRLAERQVADRRT